MLLKLYDIAISMKKKMLNEGFLEFSSTEIKFFYNVDGASSNVAGEVITYTTPSDKKKDIL